MKFGHSLKVREWAHAHSLSIGWAQQWRAGLRGVVSRRCGLSHVSTVWWRGEGHSAAMMWGHRVLRRERLQTRSDPATYVVTKAAAEKAVEEVGRHEWQEFFFSLMCFVILKSWRICWFPKFTFLFVSDVLIMKTTRVGVLAICNRTISPKTYDATLWSPWSICRTFV